MEFKNDLGLVGKIAAHSVMSGKYKDKDGNIKEILPVGPGNSLDFDQFREDIGAFGGGSGGTDIDKEHPSAGANYYAGSLADGEITERNLEWSGTDDPTKDLTVTFKDDPGSNPFGQYSGLTILGHIQKTVMTSGTKGAVSNLELNYDPSNVAKDGYFTTTSPYPIYISQSDIASGQELDVPINGIGEGLEGDNTKPAMIHLKYNSDKTMTISHEEGYVNDGNSAGATGVKYSFVVEVISTFSTQRAVAQLPPSVVLFSGNANGMITLSGTDNYYSNTMNGLEITMNTETTGGNVKYTAIGLPSVFKVPKEELVIGNKFYIPTTGMMEVADKLYDPTLMSQHYTPIAEVVGSHHYQRYFRGIKNGYFEIGTNSITFNMIITLGYNVLNSWSDEEFKVEISRVTPY